MIYKDGTGAAFQLPKMTIALQERYDAARAASDARESASLKLQLMREALGDQYVADRCGGADVESVDVSELQVLFVDVSLAYGLNGVAEIGSALAQLAPMLDQIERLNKITNTRQGFSRVV